MIGGGGTDTASFNGNFSDYSIAIDSNGDLVVSDGVADRDGSDTLVDIEELAFADGTYAVTVDPTTGEARLIGPDGEATVDQEIAAYDDPDAPEIALTGGLQAQFFDVGETLRSVEDIDWSTEPTATSQLSEIDFSNGNGAFREGGATDQFGLKVTGDFEVEEGGAYRFEIGSDDGALLYIDGELVVDNDGVHAFRREDGSIELDPGSHSIELLYIENTGQAGLTLSWSGPDTDGEEALFNANPVEEISADDGYPLSASVDTNGQDLAAVSIDGLPADTILHDGTNSLVTGGGGEDLTDWDLSSLEIMPPSGFSGDISATITVSVENSRGTLSHNSSDIDFSVAPPEGGDATAAGPAPALPPDMGPEDGSWVDTADGAAGGGEAEENALSEDVAASDPGDPAAGGGFDTYEEASV